ncbi:MAG: hypothetical protein QM723_19215 [Myxococcaceae bacterium]
MSPKTVSFILVTLSLGFTAFAFSQVPLNDPSADQPIRYGQPVESGYRHYAARARNGSTQKSAPAQPAPIGLDGGAPLIWDPTGTGNHGLDNGLDGGASGAGSSGDQTNNPHR